LLIGSNKFGLDAAYARVNTLATIGIDVERQTRRCFEQVRLRQDAAIGEFLSVENRDRNRNFYQVLTAFACSDDDFL